MMGPGTRLNEYSDHGCGDSSYSGDLKKENKRTLLDNGRGQQQPTKDPLGDSSPHVRRGR